MKQKQSEHKDRQPFWTSIINLRHLIVCYGILEYVTTLLHSYSICIPVKTPKYKFTQSIVLPSRYRWVVGSNPSRIIIYVATMSSIVAWRTSFMKRIVRTELTITHVEPKTNTKALDSIYDWTFYNCTIISVWKSNLRVKLKTWKEHPKISFLCV